MTRNFSFSDINNELQVLIRAGEAALDKTKKPLLDEWLKEKTCDWEKVYQLACVHQIRPLLLRGVSRLQNADIPANILQKLKADCFQISARSLANTNEMLRLLEIYKQQGILAVPYKGAYLANQYYGDFGLREFSDIDLFVNEEDIDRIKIVMNREGYKTESDIQPNQEKMFFYYWCEYNFDLSDKNGNRLYHVEPHFRSNHKICDIDLTVNDFKNDISEIAFLRKNIFTLNKEAHLILTTTNHGLNEGWTSLKYIFDLYQILQKDGDTLDWESLKASFNKLHILPTFLVGYSVLNQLFNLEIPEPLKDLIEENKINQLTEQRLYKLKHYSKLGLDSQWNKFIYNIKCRTSLISQLKMIYFQFAAPGKAELDIISLPSWLSFLYLLIRPIRVFKDRVLS